MTGQICAERRSWRHRVARSVGGGPIGALRLAQDSRRHAGYATGRMTCAQFAPNGLGAPNDPGAIDDRYWEETGEDPIAAYAEFDRDAEQ